MQEAWGLALFEDEVKGNCATCRISEPGPNGEPPLITDFTYDNLGIPKNPDNPFYTMPKKWNPDGADWIDYGLGGFLEAAGYDDGHFLTTKPNSQIYPQLQSLMKPKKKDDPCIIQKPPF